MNADEFEEWVNSPERVLRFFTRFDDDGVTAGEINRRRSYGTYSPVSVDVEKLQACKRKGLVTYEKGKWYLKGVNNS